MISSAPRLRVIDLETAGNGVCDVCEIGWQDVIQGADGQWRLDNEHGARFVNPGRPISPETMAIHHILDSDVASAPYWPAIAGGILRPAHSLLALAAHRASFEQRFCTTKYTGDTPWICTWKCALRLWPELASFSNQMLRYQRKPDGLIHTLGLPAHRALPDAYVTAHHLRDMLNAASLDQLLTWSREPGLLPRVPQGSDRGRPWRTLLDDTLCAFRKDRDINIRFSAETELARRGKAPASAPEAPRQQTLL